MKINLDFRPKIIENPIKNVLKISLIFHRQGGRVDPARAPVPPDPPHLKIIDFLNSHNFSRA